MKLLRFAAPGAVVLVCILFYWKLTLTGEYVWFNHPDMCYIELPRLQFQAKEMHSGRFPLWTTGIWMGQPLLGQTQPGPVFPLNIAFLLLPLKEGYLDFRYLNWYFVVVHAIAAVGMFALCRDLRRSVTASALAGLVFAFGGFIGAIAWLDVLNGAVWTPLICLFFLRSVRGTRTWANAAICGLVLGIAWLSGHHEVPLMVSYALAGAWLFAGWRKGPATLAPMAAAFAIAGLVAAIQLWPTAEFAKLSRRWVGLEYSYGWKDALPYASPSGYSLPVRALPGIAVDDSSNHADSTPFVGLCAFSLAMFAIYTSWRAPAVRWFVAAGTIALVFALAAATPLHGLLFSYLPLLGKARVPVRGIHLLNFALAVLAAFGLDAVLRVATVRPLTRALAAAGVALILLHMWRPAPASDGIVTGALTALVLSALIVACKRGRITRPAFAGSVLCLSIFELYPVATRTFPSSADKNGQQFVRVLTNHADVVAFLRSEPAPRRVAVDDAEIPANFGDWHGFDGLEGYVAGATGNLLEVPRHTRAIQNLYGVTHYVGREPLRPGFQEAFTATSGIKVWRNPEALPRVWSVHSAVQVRARGDVDARLSEPGFDPRRTAIFAGIRAPVLEPCEGDNVRLAARAPNRIRVDAQMKCKGLVVVSETWYPGWIARVDGREAEVLETFGTLRGVVVDAGTHTVELSYRPLSVYGGAALSATGFTLAFAAVLLDRRRFGQVREIPLRASSAGTP